MFPKGFCPSLSPIPTKWVEFSWISSSRLPSETQFSGRSGDGLESKFWNIRVFTREKCEQKLQIISNKKLKTDLWIIRRYICNVFKNQRCTAIGRGENHYFATFLTWEKICPPPPYTHRRSTCNVYIRLIP